MADRFARLFHYMSEVFAALANPKVYDMVVEVRRQIHPRIIEVTFVLHDLVARASHPSPSER